jgi:hypothetical protein
MKHTVAEGNQLRLPRCLSSSLRPGITRPPLPLNHESRAIRGQVHAVVRRGTPATYQPAGEYGIGHSPISE